MTPSPELVGGLESPDYASHDRAGEGPYVAVFTGDLRREFLVAWLAVHLPRGEEGTVTLEFGDAD